MKTLNFRFFQIFILSILLTSIISCESEKTDSNNDLSVQQTKNNNILDSIETERKKYKSITIGKQEWMNEDLSVEIFLNGDSIFHAKSNKEWELAFKNKQPAWCYVSNKKNEFDKFYNIHVLTDERGIAPDGWKIPSICDWQILANHINKSQKSCQCNWVIIPRSIDDYGFINKNNGFRFRNGEFYSSNKNSFYWALKHEKSRTQEIATNAYQGNGGLWFKWGGVFRVAYDCSGFQIRCIKKERTTTNESESAIPTVNANVSQVSTIKIGNLEVMTEDLGQMTWEDAKKACADLGDGWRLPTKDELNVLYENKDKIGGFANSTYWSSTEGGNYIPWQQDFGTGFRNSNLKLYSFDGYVRAVRAF